MTSTTCALIIIISTIFSPYYFVNSQEYTMLPISVKKCDNSPSKENGLDIFLEIVEEKNKGMVFSLNGNLTIEINKDCTYQMNVEIFRGEDFSHYLDTGGAVCDSLTSIFKPAWEKVKSSIDPSLEEECLIKPGSYSLKEFEISKKDLETPVPVEGKFRTKINFYCENRVILCTMLFLNIIEEDE